MKFARRPRQEVEINLTPLIDVVFLLLIFYMVSTTFTRESHLFIELPTAAIDTTKVPEVQLEVSISKDGNYAVNGVPLVDREIATLRRAILTVSESDNSLPMTITADSAAPHQFVVTAMDAAGQLGFTRLLIATRPSVDAAR